MDPRRVSFFARFMLTPVSQIKSISPPERLLEPLEV
jgi:hypothetical protein